jgi:hypothetical protein
MYKILLVATVVFAQFATSDKEKNSNSIDKNCYENLTHYLNNCIYTDNDIESEFALIYSNYKNKYKYFNELYKYQDSIDNIYNDNYGRGLILFLAHQNDVIKKTYFLKGITKYISSKHKKIPDEYSKYFAFETKDKESCYDILKEMLSDEDLTEYEKLFFLYGLMSNDLNFKYNIFEALYALCIGGESSINFDPYFIKNEKKFTDFIDLNNKYLSCALIGHLSMLDQAKYINNWKEINKIYDFPFIKVCYEKYLNNVLEKKILNSENLSDQISYLESNKYGIHYAKVVKSILTNCDKSTSVSVINYGFNNPENYLWDIIREYYRKDTEEYIIDTYLDLYNKDNDEEQTLKILKAINNIINAQVLKKNITFINAIEKILEKNINHGTPKIKNLCFCIITKSNYLEELLSNKVLASGYFEYYEKTKKTFYDTNSLKHLIAYSFNKFNLKNHHIDYNYIYKLYN